MPFFIENTTKCAICDQLISHVMESTILPYIHPEEFPHLKNFARRYVHRNCYNSWEHQSDYSNGSFKLVKNAESNNPNSNTLYMDKLIIVRHVKGHEYSINDFETQLDFNFREENINTAIENLEQVLSSDEIKVEVGDWKLSKNSNAVHFMKYYDEEPVDLVYLSHARFEEWKEAIDILKKHSGIAKTSEANEMGDGTELILKNYSLFGKFASYDKGKLTELTEPTENYKGFYQSHALGTICFSQSPLPVLDIKGKQYDLSNIKAVEYHAEGDQRTVKIIDSANQLIEEFKYEVKTIKQHQFDRYGKQWIKQFAQKFAGKDVKTRRNRRDDDQNLSPSREEPINKVESNIRSEL